jgi:histidine triad (HIT) family protein
VSVDANCLFCRIAAGEIPSRGVYGDERAYAFLDIQPWHRGHTLVVPRRHVVDLIHGEAVMAHLGPAIDSVSRLLVDRLAADGLNLLVASGPVAGQEVFHLHVHLVPRYADTPGAAQLVNPHSVPDAELDDVHARLTAKDRS